MSHINADEHGFSVLQKTQVCRRDTLIYTPELKVDFKSDISEVAGILFLESADLDAAGVNP